MKKGIRILLVDDHPMTVKGYQMFLKILETDYNFEMKSAHNCDQVLEKMKKHKHSFFDIVLLDINLPPSFDRTVIGGEDLGLLIRQKFPDTKIIVHTVLNDQQRISNIFKSINPEGFLIKSDLKPEVLKDSINSILNGHTYYSEQTNRLIGNGKSEEIFLDSSDLKILHHLSKGERMKNLPKYVPLAMATIERRKKKLKLLFNVPNGSNKELLDVARKKGFL